MSSVDVNDLKMKLGKYVIDPDRKPEHKHIPKTLAGEILLEEVKNERGEILGWITIAPENLANILAKIKSKEIDAEASGHKKYLDKFKNEGINL
jgi:hypothetical protein